jgi:hypothetical protein
VASWVVEPPYPLCIDKSTHPNGAKIEDIEFRCGLEAELGDGSVTGFTSERVSVRKSNKQRSQERPNNIQEAGP